MLLTRALGWVDWIGLDRKGHSSGWYGVEARKGVRSSVGPAHGARRGQGELATTLAGADKDLCANHCRVQKRTQQIVVTRDARASIDGAKAAWRLGPAPGCMAGRVSDRKFLIVVATALLAAAAAGVTLGYIWETMM